MTDTEMEIALLALGPALEWNPPGFYVTTSLPVTKGEWYQVHRSRTQSGFSCYRKRLGQATIWNPVMLPTDAAAKAACERHHASGEWE